MHAADEAANEGDWPEATREYLLALDQGRQRDSAFSAARGEVVRKLATLAQRYPPAQEALAARTYELARKVRLAIESRGDVDGMDVLLFVQLGINSGNEAEVRATNLAAKTDLPADSKLRIRLAGAVEEYLVQERRYRDAIAESDPGTVTYYLSIFKSSREDPNVAGAIALTVRNEGGTHYEALLGAGQPDEAAALAEKLLEYAPSAETYQALLERARRSGAQEAVAHLQGQARAHGITASSDTSRTK